VNGFNLVCSSFPSDYFYLIHYTYAHVIQHGTDSAVTRHVDGQLSALDKFIPNVQDEHCCVRDYKWDFSAHNKFNNNHCWAWSCEMYLTTVLLIFSIAHCCDNVLRKLSHQNHIGFWFSLILSTILLGLSHYRPNPTRHAVTLWKRESLTVGKTGLILAACWSQDIARWCRLLRLCYLCTSTQIHDLSRHVPRWILYNNNNSTNNNN